MPTPTIVLNRFALSLLAGAACLAAGCGQPGRVSGLVTLDGAVALKTVHGATPDHLVRLLP